jgi:hypothetical protein
MSKGRKGGGEKESKPKRSQKLLDFERGSDDEKKMQSLGMIESEEISSIAEDSAVDEVVVLRGGTRPCSFLSVVDGKTILFIPESRAGSSGMRKRRE